MAYVSSAASKTSDYFLTCVSVQNDHAIRTSPKSGRIKPNSLVVFDRIDWSRYSEFGGRFAPKSATQHNL
jgi:hypothetical protein